MWRQRLEPDLIYILDLLQLTTGRRYLLPRLATAPPAEHAVLFSNPYRGSDLMSWREYGQVAECVELRDGGRFALDAHGTWFMPEEMHYLHHGQVEGADPPWFNALPPLLPKAL